MGAVETNERGEVRESQTQQGERKLGLLANWRILLFTLYIGMSLFEYGYDKGAIAGFQAMPGFLQVFGYQLPNGTWGIKPDPQRMITSFMTVGSLVGAMSTGPIGAHLCRRYSLMLACTALLVSIVLMVVTTSFGVLYFARILCGLGNGVVMNFAFVYLQEVTPPHLRSLCFGIASFWITFGTTLGMVVNNATVGVAGRLSYQIPLYVCFPIPVALILSLPFLPESPRWLLHHNRPEEALKALRFFRKGAYDEVAVQQEFEEMKAVAAREAESEKNWRLVFELFKGTNLRRTIVCVGVTCANAGVGAMFILSFGTYFFTIAEVDSPFKWIVITNCLGVVGLFLSWFLVQRMGQRRLILAGCVICSASMVTIAALYTAPLSSAKAGVGLIVATSFYLFGFNLGLESYTFLTSGELPAQNLRAYTLGLSVGVSFIFAWLCTFTTPYYINPAELNWGPKYAWIWFGSSLIATAFIYFLLPDVKGRSLEEIDEMFRNKVPTRAFKTYVCVEIEEARARGVMNALAGEKALALDEKPSGKHVESVS
ncbi:related to HXT1 - Low-affinity hexose facilitator [Cephalotrichum gorgonifer]|uniref:Related to HXT1 - Low-affinity hexose facilitator n=1 Tax=Cephalotrichum gorgonifer TaxID=2041049 RepID=A0AAE8N8R0_9PEZI|nr:related to HXT1 - Low-affinity hexose facilitator [Cephalotrichum gorgonifer]